MIAMWRVLTAALAVPLCFAVIGSGLDRISDTDEAAASAVPSPFRANAPRAEANRLLETRDAREAAASAELAVARNPTDARAVGLYGQALLSGGSQVAAARAFAVSRRLGWREPFTNIYWVRDGLRAGDLNLAADHLDALLRQSPQIAQRGALLTQLEATREGRSALAARLARRPEWQISYFFDTALPGAGDPLARSEVARRLALNQGIRNCGLISPIIRALLHFGHMAEAQDLYRLNCAAAAEPVTPADGSFVRANPATPPTDLDWRFSGEGAVGITIAARGGYKGRAVTVSNLAPVLMAFAAEPLALAPGMHRVSWRAQDTGGAPSPAIDVSVACGPDDHAWAAKRLLDARSGRFVADVSVPAGCMAAYLSFGIAPSASNVALGEVAVD
jgi:hypothetical protein